MRPRFNEQDVKCGSCIKVFCCKDCRIKHENKVHPKTELDSTRVETIEIEKSLQNDQSITSFSHPNRFNYERFLAEFPDPERRQNVLHIYFQMTKHLLKKADDEEDTTLEDSSIQSEDDGSAKNDILTDETTTQQSNKTSDNTLEETVNLSSKENIPDKQNKSPFKIIKRTAGNTPPRKSSVMIDSIIEILSSPDIDNDQAWKSAQNDVCDLSTSEIREISSVYFACESLSKTYSVTECDTTKEDIGGFETFAQNPNLASTKFEITQSFDQESFEANGTKIDSAISTDVEFLTASVIEDNSNIVSTTDSTQAGDNKENQKNNSTESTISANGSAHSINFAECSSIYQSAPPEFLSEWTRALATQTSFQANSKNASGIENDKEKSLPKSEVSSRTKIDLSLWQSVSLSIKRACNSIIGRRNKSKRTEDDEEQPEPKRPKLLCRQSWRDGVRIIFKEDGEVKVPVVVYDRGMQTEYDSAYPPLW